MSAGKDESVAQSVVELEIHTRKCEIFMVGRFGGGGGPRERGKVSTAQKKMK